MAAAESDPKRKAELENIAKVCARVPYETPRTMQEAIQAVWFTQIMLYTEENTAAYTIDRVDQYLYPFYKADLEAGRITEKEGQELLECLWIKMGGDNIRDLRGIVRVLFGVSSLSTPDCRRGKGKRRDRGK